MKFLQFAIRSRAICLALVTIVDFHGNRIWTLGANKSPVCDTPECKALGEAFKKNMNPDYKPCKDFYNYVCHGWGDQNPRPRNKEWWNVEEFLGRKIKQELKSIMEDKQVTKASNFEQAKALYRACMNLPSMERADRSVIRETIKKTGSWPMFLPKDTNFDWSLVDDKYITMTGEPALFDYTLNADVKHENLIIIFLKRMNSPYGMLKRYRNWQLPDEKKRYKAYLNEVIKNVAPSDPARIKDVLDKDLDDVIQFRTAIYEIKKAAAKNEKFETMTIKKFQELYDNEAKSKNSAKINWLTKIRAMYKNSKNAYGMTVQATDTIKVAPKYFALLADLLGKTPTRVIVNHIHLYFAERNVKITYEMIKELQKSVVGSVLINGEIRYEQERWIQCLSQHNMRVTLGQMYVKHVFPEQDRYEVHQFVEKTKSLLKSQIAESTWLNSVTKLMAMKKIDAIQTQIGYPYWLTMNNPIGSYQKLDIDPLNIDAYFVPQWDKFYISAGYLQPPIYNRNVPYVIDYGSTIALTGHELYHTFDRLGLQFWKGKEGKWWPQDMLDEYNERARCFTMQYSEYRKKELKKYGITSPPDLPKTYNEDMADVMGLKLAYKGFKQRLDADKAGCQVLPGFENFGCEKMFFITFANALCTNASPNAYLNVLLTDTHSPPRVRVNGAVSNMKEFATAFGCKNGDPLNIERRCDIWTK